MKMQKFGFSIKTRDGMSVDNLTIQGLDAADAERKLRLMYHHCTVLECRPLDGLTRGEGTDLEGAISLIVGGAPEETSAIKPQPNIPKMLR
ncbi:MAG TPA: hypothetical protein VF928_11035 [Usitatibacteraceae bacterium]